MNTPIKAYYLTSELDRARECLCPGCNSEYFTLSNDSFSVNDDPYDIRVCDDCDEVTIVDYVNAYDADIQKPVLIKEWTRGTRP